MELLKTIGLGLALLIPALSLMVIIHELGHYLPARWFGMRVEKFYLFFDWPRKLWSFNHKGTEYGIGLLPLGGYVKISGIIDESMDKEHLNKPVEPWEFRAKPVWQRLIVMVGGVTMNVILGIIIFTVIVAYKGEEKIPVKSKPFSISVVEGSTSEELGFKDGDKLISFKGQPIQYLEDVMTPMIFYEDSAWFEVERDGKIIPIYIPNDYINKYSDRIDGKDKKKRAGEPIFYPYSVPIIDSVIPNRIAAKSLLQKGDKIIAVNDKIISSTPALQKILEKNKNKTIQLIYERNGQNLAMGITLDSTALLGIALKNTIQTERLSYNFGESLSKGVGKAFGTIGDNIKGFKKIAAGDVDASKSVSGPVGIAKHYVNLWQSNGFMGFWLLTGMLSMVLAFINILPIPALDGGHVVFLLIEAITKKEPSVKVRMWAQMVGMIILLMLMVFSFLNDIIKLFV